MDADIDEPNDRDHSALRLRREPLLATLLVALAAFAAATSVLMDGAAYGTVALLLIAVTLSLGTLIAVTAILIVRAPWGRWFASLVAVGSIVAVARLDVGAAAVVTVVAGMAALFVLGGPWLDTWLRRRPAVGPGPVPVALALGALMMPFLVAVLDPTTPAALLPAVVVPPMAAVSYVRAMSAGLWLLRVATPAAGVVAVLIDRTPAAGAVALACGAITWLAWMKPSRIAVAPLMDRLPGPRRARPRGIDSNPSAGT